jgi:hypothetical protein
MLKMPFLRAKLVENRRDCSVREEMLNYCDGCVGTRKEEFMSLLENVIC